MSTQQKALWPDQPIIRIIEGYDSIEKRPIRDTIAVASSDPETLPGSPSRGTRLYTRAGGGLLCQGAGDRIYSWEEMAVVPVSLLRELRAAFEARDGRSPAVSTGGRMADVVHALLADLPR